MADSEKIVACGMSGRLPESEDLKEFWEHLMNKDNLLSRDSRRWDSEFLKLPRGSGLLKDISRFDASFFGMLPKQVNKTDPQLRILLEVAYEAIVDAGFNPQELEGSKTGVYVASSYADANIVFAGDMQATDGYSFTGSVPAFLSNRLSYWFDFKGPSYTLDAVCASALLVLQIAMKDILSGECDYALVGAVSTTLRPQTTYQLNQLQVLSPDGTCKTFDKSANGYVRAESVLAVFITRESLCRRAYGQLVHSVVNHSGFSQQGISFPSPEAQTNLLSKAYSEAGISPNEVEYIEAHGTGTKSGDPTEANALHKVFCQHRSKTQPLLIGAVKSNMGHSECAAGLASLIKVLLTINEGVIPPNLHFNEPDRRITGLMDGSLKVVTEKTTYLGGPIGINAFGFGGLNVHTIVKPYYVKKQDFSTTVPKIVISSGRTKEGVTKSLKYLATNMTDDTFHYLASQVADTPVERMPYRGYKIQIGAKSTEHVQKVQVSGNRPVWFIFSGMGSQWPGMGKDLMVVETFRKSIEKCHKALEIVDPNIKLIDLIMSGTKEKVDETIGAFVTIISIQIALVNCLKDLGIRADGIVGHSMGETSCAFADELITEEQTILAIYWRARCVLNGNPPPGRMASVGLGWDEVKTRIPKGVVAACQNAEDNTTISGNRKAIEAYVCELESEGVFARIVNTGGIAYHSPDMFPIAPALQTALQKVITNNVSRSASWKSTSISDHQRQTEHVENFNAHYLVNNLVSPVRFYDAVRKIPSKAIVIEIAPHGLMKNLLKKSLHSESDYISLMSLKESDNLQYFLSNIGKLFTFGVPLHLTNLYPPIKYPLGTGSPMLSPGVNWDHSNKWIVPSWEEFVPDRSVFSKEIDVGEGGNYTFLKDHNIDGRDLYPATGYVVLAWQAIANLKKTVPEKLAIEFKDITIHRATAISNSGIVTLTVRIEKSANLFHISESDELTVSGMFILPEEPFVPTDQRSLVDDGSLILCQDDFYKELRLIGYNYGPKFRGVKRSAVDGSEAVLEWNGNWITFLDTMLQVAVFGKDNPSRSLFLPTRIRSLRINPILQNNKITGSLNTGEYPVSVDTCLDTCYSGGVELEGLHTSIAPKKQVKESVTLEFLEFVPYGKFSLLPRRDVLEYGRICKEYLQLLLKYPPFKNPQKDSNVLVSNALEETEVYAKLTSCLCQDDSGYMKVLHEIGTIKECNDFFQVALSIVDAHALELANDKFLSLLPKNHTFKNLLDVVWENSNTRKIKVVEIGARFGALFIFISPCMMSQPLLELDLTATDTNVEELSEAFENELKLLRVKVDFLDIKEEIANDYKSKNLVVVRGLAQQSASVQQSLKNIHSMLLDGGFLMLHEITSNFDMHLDFYGFMQNFPRKSSCDINFPPCLTCNEWEDMIDEAGFDVIQQSSDGISSTLFLCRKRRKDVSEGNAICIPVSGKEFNWVEDVKNELRNLQSQDSPDRIWLIAENDCESGIIGFVNCLRQEDGGDKVRCIFNANHESSHSKPLMQSPPLQQFLKTDLVMNVFKNGSWGSYRHHFLDTEEFSASSHNAYVDILTRGDLSSLQWIQLPASTTSDDISRVRCTVQCSSLNFRDIMLASGKVNRGALSDYDMHRECLLGSEFSGYDPEGKRVMGIVSNQGLATHVSTEPQFLFDVPDSWSLEEAATVPLVYCTVYYSLVVRGQIKRGESILIHAGSGGVGQAAIAVALSYGCKIYTTVGTEEKRKFLMKKFPTLTESCFANSRDTSFERFIKRQTNGLGVNLVLNSLSGEIFEASLRCLSKYGRFLEIGKYDLSQNKQIGSSIFLKNISFHGIMLDSLCAEGHPEWATVVNLMTAGLRNGVVKPLPRTVFARDEVEAAFRYMAKGKHIGKVLINITPVKEKETLQNPVLLTKSRYSCYQEKVYLIVGGLGGFGLELANWLVTRGCKKLVITTRSGIKNGYQSRCLHRWQKLGVEMQLSQLDVSNLPDCYKLLHQCKSMGPIGGIFNVALVLKDALLENLYSKDFKEVSKPKLEVASNLDRATRQLCGPEMDLFVMFSSVSSGRGNAGQTNYGYANSAMERICEIRREDQLPALAIQWGGIGDVGVVADSTTGNDTVIAGCATQTLHSCLSTLDLFLSCRKPVLASLVKARSGEDTACTVQNTDMGNFISRFFGIDDISSTNKEKTLAELGLDSIMAVEVKQTLERDYSCSLSMKQLRSLSLKQLLNISNDHSLVIEEDNKHENSVIGSFLPLISPILNCKTTGCLVRLNPGSKNKDPIFLFHPIEGSIDVFRPLGKELLDYPVFAVQFTKMVPTDSVSSMAKYYLSQMRLVKENGPYNLVGYSFGALVALEIARVLQNDKNLQSVTKLLLVDGSPSYAIARMFFIFEKKYPLNKDDETLGSQEALKVQALIHFVQLFTKIPFNEIKQQLLQKPSYKSKLALVVQMVSKVITNADHEDVTFSIDSYVQRIMTILSYQPKDTWNMDMVLFKAKSCNHDLLVRVGSNDYNLSTLCSGKVEVHMTEGEHETILQDPGVQKVASIIKDVF